MTNEEDRERKVKFVEDMFNMPLDTSAALRCGFLGELFPKGGFGPRVEAYSGPENRIALVWSTKCGIDLETFHDVTGNPHGQAYEAVCEWVDHVAEVMYEMMDKAFVPTQPYLDRASKAKTNRAEVIELREYTE